jgi:hypothetical protein|nr:MAG TPA: BRO family protein [Caudoviricetes sp.]
MYDDETDTTVPVSADEIDIEDEQELEFIMDETIRKVWKPKEEEWYFSIVDVCQFLTDSTDTKQYIKKMKQRDKELANNWGTICTLLPIPAADGKMRRSQVATAEGILRIIQSIPSKKAEPFKQWLAQVGAERLDEIADPEKAMERAIATYRAKGYSEEWITQRIRSIEIRKEMTDEWNRAGVKNGKEYAVLTNILTSTWSGKTVREYKKLKGLRKENLRDNMTNTELVLNQLAEISTTEISKATNPKGYDGARTATLSGGKIAANARKDLEKQLGRSVISPLNATAPNMLDDKRNK